MNSTGAAIGIALLWTLGCAGPAPSIAGSAHFESASWDDGLAVVATYRGRVKRYGAWRPAVARDYLVREALDPVELTKRDAPKAGALRVLKANRLLEFETGSYSYRLMSSTSFARADGRLVRARGSCQNACGLVYHAWDERSGSLQIDSYWEGEGSQSVPLPAALDRRFADELPFIADRLDDGELVRVVAPLVSPRSLAGATTEAAGLGIGDMCVECLGLDAAEDVQPSAQNGPALTVFAASLTARRTARPDGGTTCELVDREGRTAACFRYDAEGFLVGWVVAGEQEFERVRIARCAYWERVAPGDRALVR